MRALMLLVVAGCSYSPRTAAVDDGRPTDAPAGALTDAPVDTAPVTQAWAFKRTLTINNVLLAEQLGSPILVQLDASRISYGAVQDDGEDLRFEDLAGTPLAYEIERWNPAGTSTVWVRVPTIAANTTTQLFMYYGNPTAPAATNGPAVWDDDYLGVWHLADAHDSTQTSVSTNQNATPLATGKLGPAMQFAGGTSNEHVDTGLSTFSKEWLVEAWINPDTAAVSNGASSPVSGFPNYMILYSCNGATFCQSVLFNHNSGQNTSFVNYAVAPTVWSYVVGRYDGTTIRAFVNGVQVGTNPTMATPDAQTVTTKIGSRMDLQGDFDGGIDEVRISKTPRSGDYISAQFRSMTDTYVSYGAEQPNR